MKEAMKSIRDDTYIGAVLTLPGPEETPILDEIAGFEGATVPMGGWTPTEVATEDCKPCVADDPGIAVEEGTGQEATGVTATGLDATSVAATEVTAPGVSAEAAMAGPWEAEPFSTCMPWPASFWASSRAS